MAEQRVQRRLAAILAADVVGYSRLMEADEEGTRTRLTSLLTGIIEPQIAADGGRIVKTIGDGILVEYPSAVDAVRSALALQSAVAHHNTHLLSGQPLVFRMGINVGDVIIEGDDIHGDGVNVAARLEGICLPGEVYISGTVQDHVEGKLAALFEDLGDQSVKNITRPVRVYRVRPVAAKTPSASDRADPSPASDKPAIAVLPFENMAGDDRQDYFADGITEDIITELSRLPELLVISRNSTFTYKGKVAKVQDVCKDLGVGYVVEGRVRKAGDRVRINAQLIDGRTGGHLWAERYDRELEDIFAVQDDVAEKIVQALEINLVHGRTRQEAEKRFHDTEAYDCVLRGREQYRLFTKEGNAAARDHYQRAIDLDPNYAEPYAGLAETYVQDWFLGAEPTLDRAFDYARMAAARDADLPLVHEALSTVHLFQGRHDEAVEIARRWTELEPSSADACAALAGAKHFAGENEEVIALIEKAMRLNPLYPFFYPHYMGLANMGLRRYEQAVAALKRGANRNPEALWPHVFLAACFALLNKEDEAATEVAEVRRISPDFSVASARKLLPYKRSEDFDQLVEGLQLAGLSKSAEEKVSLAFPDKPSIAVLPFENMSGDPEQEYFSDGITEDLITDLAKISGLFVVARNAAFLYKGKAIKPAEVSRELDVRYVLEGSVRRAGQRVRITAQLIDPLTGYHLWAERYDRDLTDIFALQDEITEKIVAALEVKLTAGEREQVERHYTENLEAYDYFLRGRAYDARSTRDANARSREMFQRAIALDPNFAGAYAVLSHTHWRDWRNQWSDDPAVLEMAFEAARMAVSLDGTLPIARTYLGWICVFRQEHEKAVAEAEKAVRLDPGFAEGYARLAVILGFADKPKEAFEAIQNALRLDPHYPPSYDLYLGMACFALGKYDDAVTALKKSLTRNPEALGSNLWLAAALNILGRDDEANAQMAEVMRISPRATERDLRERSPFKNQVLKNLFFTVLRKAGLPE